jgi:TonB family protein
MIFIKRVSFILLAILFCTQAALAGPNLEKELRSTLKGKTLPLKSTCPQEKLNFDAQGALTQHCPEGSWTVYSLFRIEKIKLHKTDLELTGMLDVDTVVATQPGTALAIPVSHGLVLTFQLSAALSDMPSANKILAAAFDSDAAWKEKLAPYKQPPPVPKEKGQQQEGEPSAPGDGDKRDDDKKDAGLLGMLGPDRPVYRFVPHTMQPPVATFQPDPEYTTAARKAKLQGTILLMLVINERGEPAVIKVLRRLGSGLDEQALLSVSGWKFKPGKKDGQPVAVLVDVEVEFHLF